MSNHEINARIAELNAHLTMDNRLRNDFEKAIADVFSGAGEHVETQVLDKIIMSAETIGFDSDVMAGPQPGP